MNNARRKTLDEACRLLYAIQSQLEDAKLLIENVSEEETESYENLSEGLQESDRGVRMEEVASTLQEIAEEIGLDIADITTRIEECKQ